MQLHAWLSFTITHHNAKFGGHRPCSLVNETHTIMLVQAGTQANPFASAIDRTSTITNFTKNCSGKVPSFLKTQNRLVL